MWNLVKKFHPRCCPRFFLMGISILDSNERHKGNLELLKWSLRNTMPIVTIGCSTISMGSVGWTSIAACSTISWSSKGWRLTMGSSICWGSGANHGKRGIRLVQLTEMIKKHWCNFLTQFSSACLQSVPLIIVRILCWAKIKPAMTTIASIMSSNVRPVIMEIVPPTRPNSILVLSFIFQCK